MSKVKKIIGIILCALVLTGCEIKYEGNVEITKDGKMNMSIIMAYDRELISNLIYMQNNDDLLGEDINSDEDESNVPEASMSEIRKYLEENKPEEQKGLEVSRYERNNFYGYQMSYEIENIDDVSSPDDIESSLFEDLNIKNDSNDNDEKEETKMLFKKEKDTYYAKYLINDDTTNENFNLSMLNMSIKYTVTLPTKPIKHNADEVSEDGKTLSWNLSELDGEKEAIEYSFKLKDTPVAAAKESGINTEMIMLIAGIVIIIIIIVIVLVLFARNNKKLNKSLEAIDQTIPSAAPKTNAEVENTVTPQNNQNPIDTAAQNNNQMQPTIENSTPIEMPQQNTNTTPPQIETIQVVESIPVINNNQITEQNNTIETQPQEPISQEQTVVPNLEEMPIIMEPPVMMTANTNNQNVQTVQNQTNNINEVNQNIQETVVQVEANPVPNENANNVTNLETNIEPEQTVTPSVVEQNVIEQPVVTPIEPQKPIIEEVAPTLQQTANVVETNIFDTPTIENDTLKVEEVPENINSTTTIKEEPITTIEPINITPNEAVVQEVPKQPTIETVSIEEVKPYNEIPTVEPTTVENVSIQTETINEPTMANQPINSTNTQIIEEPKLEVLENNNTTLEEPDIPLPEPIVEKPVESVVLEEVKEENVVENRFIQTDFIENRKEEQENNNTNM